MGVTITHSTGTILPVALSRWAAETPVNTIIHDVLNRSNPDVTHRAAGLRRGTLTLSFATGTDAYAARSVLLGAEVFTLTHSTVAPVGMSFVVADGDLSDVLGDAGEWTLTVPFVEVTP